MSNYGIICIYSDPRRAEDFFRVGLASGYEYAYFDLGFLYESLAKQEKDEKQRKQHYEMALGYYERQIRSSLISPEAYNRRGLCYYDLEEFPKAIQDLKKAICLKPNDPKYYSYLGMIYSASGQMTESNRCREIADNIKKLKQIPEYKTKRQQYKHALVKLLTCEGTFSLERQGDFWWNPFPDWGIAFDDGGIFLGNCLNWNPRVKTFSLYRCHLSNDGMRSIAEQLKSNTTIEVLRLEWNSLITNAGIWFLADALKENLTVRKLSLAHNDNITTEAIIYLINNAPDQLEEISFVGCKRVNQTKALTNASNQQFQLKDREVLVRKTTNTEG